MGTGDMCSQATWVGGPDHFMTRTPPLPAEPPQYMDSISAEYFLATTSRLSFCVAVSSPPGTESSVSRTTNFCTFCARDAAAALARSMPSWTALATLGSALASATVVAEEPIACIASKQVASSLSVGCGPTSVGSITTRSVSRHERNLRLSPMSTALLTIGHCSLTWSSTRTGGTFSPPAVMMSSLMRPVIASIGVPLPSGAS
mmetsp:Transcript_24953/g.71690  ORF Transcript_24953/g.71690 Transcript_24953/m.71690 type:complete len:203 (+) Transcript_24953:232-840(+)